jgi:hypothetical protein
VVWRECKAVAFRTPGITQFKIAETQLNMTSIAYTTDTSAEAHAVQMDCLRAMTPQQRIELTCSISQQVRRMAFDAIRRLNPQLSEEEVQLVFIELTYGKLLSDEVRRWREERGD